MGVESRERQTVIWLNSLSRCNGASYISYDIYFCAMICILYIMWCILSNVHPTFASQKGVRAATLKGTRWRIQRRSVGSSCNPKLQTSTHQFNTSSIQVQYKSNTSPTQAKKGPTLSCHACQADNRGILGEIMWVATFPSRHCTCLCHWLKHAPPAKRIKAGGKDDIADLTKRQKLEEAPPGNLLESCPVVVGAQVVPQVPQVVVGADQEVVPSTVCKLPLLYLSCLYYTAAPFAG